MTERLVMWLFVFGFFAGASVAMLLGRWTNKHDWFYVCPRCRFRGGVKCADCGGSVGIDRGPPEGWQLEDGRTVCHSCCVRDTKRVLKSVT